MKTTQYVAALSLAAMFSSCSKHRGASVAEPDPSARHLSGYGSESPPNDGTDELDWMASVAKMAIAEHWSEEKLISILGKPFMERNINDGHRMEYRRRNPFMPKTLTYNSGVSIIAEGGIVTKYAMVVTHVN